MGLALIRAMGTDKVKRPAKTSSERNKEWRLANPGYDDHRSPKINEAVKLRKAKYRQARKAEIRAYRAVWDKENADKVKVYFKNHRARHVEERLAHERNRHAKKLGAGGRHTAAEIKDLLRKQKGLCANLACKASLKTRYHADHIVPLARGGDNSIKNIQMLCPPCNLRKNAKDPIVWANENGLLL